MGFLQPPSTPFIGKHVLSPLASIRSIKSGKVYLGRTFLQKFFFRLTLLMALVSLPFQLYLAFAGLRIESSVWFVAYASVLTLVVLMNSIRTHFEHELRRNLHDSIQVGTVFTIFLFGALVDAYYCGHFSVFRSLNMEGAIHFHTDASSALINGLTIVPILLILCIIIVGRRYLQTRSFRGLQMPFLATTLSAMYCACISANWIYANFATMGSF